MPQESDLARAVRQVARAKLIVAKQRARIAQLKDAGSSTAHAEHSLEVCIRTLRVFEDHERQLRSELNDKQKLRLNQPALSNVEIAKERLAADLTLDLGEVAQVHLA